MTTKKTDFIAPDGPWKLEAKFLFQADEGEYAGHDAWATVDLKPGIVLTDAVMLAAIDNCKAQLPKGFRLATRYEFVRALLAETTGSSINFSVPGPDAFRLTGATEQPA